MRAQANEDTAEMFEQHVAPVREGLAAFLEASATVGDPWGSLPDADSRAMAEIAEEKEFEGPDPWGADPVRQAHNLASLLLVGADDFARAICRLLSGEPTPIYAHIVLARAALEHAGRAWWLLRSGASVRLRIARGVNERLYGLSQQDFLPLEGPDKKRADERKAALFAEAQRLGFRKVAKKSRVATLEESRPTSTSLIRKLLADSEDAHVGTAVFNLFSAVAHGTTYGLTHSVTTDAPGMPQTPGVTWGAVYTSSADVCSVLTAVLLGLGTAYRCRNELFGWHSEAWSRTYVDAAGRARRSLGF